MLTKKINKNFAFENFHKEFQGDTEHTFAICANCKGSCEYNKTSPLLPGEAKFMAHKKEEPLTSFRAKYLDGILMDGEIIDILKCSTCVFLSPIDYSCEIKLYKPIMCLIYPLSFEYRDGKQLIKIDSLCPLTQHPEGRFYFENKGRVLAEQLIKQLQIPNKWIHSISLFDDYDFDFNKMLANRGCSIQKYKLFELNEFLSFRKT